MSLNISRIKLSLLHPEDSVLDLQTLVNGLKAGVFAAVDFTVSEQVEVPLYLVEDTLKEFGAIAENFQQFTHLPHVVIASKLDDLDDACFYLQGLLGVSDGSFAEAWLGNESDASFWTELTRNERRDLLTRYCAAEIARAQERYDV